VCEFGDGGGDGDSGEEYSVSGWTEGAREQETILVFREARVP
jgi:hypothetical protein